MNISKSTKIERLPLKKIHTNIMESTDYFKNAIIKIRDILRSPSVSITGMDSMRHICLYVLSRYMTKSKVLTFAIPQKFSWENLIDISRTQNGGIQIAFDYFYNQKDDCLINHFDRLFGTDKFSFDIKNSQKHNEIMEICDKVNIADIDMKTDILGWIYEQHLKTGSSSSARDLGQFFTDRDICKYMVELCKPKFKFVGVPESVCDPTMGTGGFLISYMKYFKHIYKDSPIDWSVQEKEIHGCDSDPKVSALCRLNLFIESGGTHFTNTSTHDSLYNDLPYTAK